MPDAARVEPWTDDQMVYIDGRPHVYDCHEGSIQWVRLHGGRKVHAEILAVHQSEGRVRVVWPRRIRERGR